MLQSVIHLSQKRLNFNSSPRVGYILECELTLLGLTPLNKLDNITVSKPHAIL